MRREALCLRFNFLKPIFTYSRFAYVAIEKVPAYGFSAYGLHPLHFYIGNRTNGLI